MKPQFERVTFPAGCSLRVYHRQVPEIPFEWHHHPEYELTLTLNSRGWRFIGDHIGEYNTLDLVLVPPDMPHTWASTGSIDEQNPHTAIVIWFSGSWAQRMADTCLEYSALRKLLERSETGLHFAPPAGEHMQNRLNELLSESPRLRLQAALGTLIELAETEGFSPLGTPRLAAGRPMLHDEPAQLNRILDLLHRRFREPLRVQDLCEAGNLSARSLHRFFLRHVGESVTNYLCRLRIGRACLMLAETDLPISVIALESGFANLANFNRQFRQTRQMTPKEFRSYFTKHGHLPGLVPRVNLAQRPPSLEHSAQKGKNRKTDTAW